MTYEPPQDYRNFFQFALCQPIAKSKWLSVEELKNHLYQQSIVPLVYITDREHPVFKAILPQFHPKVAENLDMVVLSIVHLNNYLA